MNISKQQHKNYKPISKNESYLLSLIKKHDFTVFGIKEIYSLSGWDKNRIHNTIFSLKKKEVLTRIKRDAYTLTEHLNENIFKIATEVVIPAYISFWTALSYYGFTEQQVRTIQLVSTKQTKKLRINSHNIQIITFQPWKFYGYIRINGFAIAEKEKALIDSLFQQDRCGGLDEYAKCLVNAWTEINKKIFIRYLKKFHDKSLISRMGYLVEYLGLDHAYILETLVKEKSLSPVKLNPKKQKSGNYDSKWNVLINEKITLEAIR